MLVVGDPLTSKEQGKLDLQTKPYFDQAFLVVRTPPCSIHVWGKITRTILKVWIHYTIFTLPNSHYISHYNPIICPLPLCSLAIPMIFPLYSHYTLSVQYLFYSHCIRITDIFILSGGYYLSYSISYIISLYSHDMFIHSIPIPTLFHHYITFYIPE